MSNYKTLQIKFNLDDPFQKKLYDFVKNQTSNFSNYGRYLIQNEMNGSWKRKEIEEKTINEVAISFEDSENFI